MAKSMAVVNDGVVSNIIWCSDNTPQSNTWVNCDDRPVAIGDTYVDGKFCRDGTEVLTPLEDAQAQVESLSAQNAELLDAMAAMVEDIYNQDVSEIGGE